MVVVVGGAVVVVVVVGCGFVVVVVATGVVVTVGVAVLGVGGVVPVGRDDVFGEVSGAVCCVSGRWVVAVESGGAGANIVDVVVANAAEPADGRVATRGGCGIVGAEIEACEVVVAALGRAATVVFMGLAVAEIPPTSTNSVVPEVAAHSLVARCAGCGSARRDSSSRMRCVTSSNRLPPIFAGKTTEGIGINRHKLQRHRAAVSLVTLAVAPSSVHTVMETKGRGDKTVITNRKARHDYFVVDSFEAGMVLKGCEVKSIRDGKANLQDAYARVVNGEIFMFGMHVLPYEYAHSDKPDPLRVRKLLLHRRQILEIERETQEQGITLIPLRVFFVDGRVKVDLAIAKGKASYDKRQSLAARDAKREADRAMKGMRE